MSAEAMKTALETIKANAGNAELVWRTASGALSHPTEAEPAPEAKAGIGVGAAPLIDRIMNRIDEYAASYHVDATVGFTSGTTAAHRKAIRAAIITKPHPAERQASVPEALEELKRALSAIRVVTGHDGKDCILRESVIDIVNQRLTSMAVTTEAPKRQYYYKVNACRAADVTDSNCICWHDEGTGPLADDPGSIKTWRKAHADMPLAPSTAESDTIAAAWNAVRTEARAICIGRGLGDLLAAVEAYADLRCAEAKTLEASNG